MTTHAPMARVPFAPLDSSRIQRLASAKNRQNGIAMQLSPAPEKFGNLPSKNAFSSPNKRPFELSTFDDFDSENIDPAAFCSPSKKSKSDGLEKPFSPFTFALSPSKSMPPPPTIPSRLHTPARANMPSPRAPLTAPAGRSPKRKASAINKNRRISAPFARIDPPFSSRTDTSLPFSLDAAIKGTFSKSTPMNPGATIQESMPKNWFFDIHEDTPEEEASNLMEHSTLTLDLSSDDEDNVKARDDRGKENMPPEDYDAPTASRSPTQPTLAAPMRVKRTDLIRKKVASDEMDDGSRSPLSDLETDPFIPDGLDRNSHVLVQPTPERDSTASLRMDVSELFAGPASIAATSEKERTTTTPSKNVLDLPVVSADGDVRGDIVVWEDSPTSVQPSSLTKTCPEDLEAANGQATDENAQPNPAHL